MHDKCIEITTWQDALKEEHKPTQCSEIEFQSNIGLSFYCKKKST